jgi:hypothetical protein
MKKLNKFVLINNNLMLLYVAITNFMLNNIISNFLFDA